MSNSITPITSNISPIYTYALKKQYEDDESFINYTSLEIKTICSSKDMSYEVLDFIFAGSSGSVYKIKHKITGKIYAAKIFINGNSFNTSVKNIDDCTYICSDECSDKLYDIKKEIKIIQNLKLSLHIIHLLDYFIYKSTVVLVFEYVPNNIFDIYNTSINDTKCNGSIDDTKCNVSTNDADEMIKDNRDVKDDGDKKGKRIENDNKLKDNSDCKDDKFIREIKKGQEKKIDNYQINFIPKVNCYVESKIQIKNQTKIYIYQLLKALDYCHKKGIMHCDVKPGNILIDKSSHILKLIDFGSAQFYLPESTYNCECIGTTNYKAPEMLFKSTKIHYAVDVWAVGCVMLQLLYPREFYEKFNAHGDDNKHIENLNSRFGTAALEKFCTKYNLVHYKLTSIDFDSRRMSSWAAFLGVEMDLICLNLMERLLELDPLKRITCADALYHPYF